MGCAGDVQHRHGEQVHGDTNRTKMHRFRSGGGGRATEEYIGSGSDPT